MARYERRMSDAQANYIRRAYGQAGLKPTDENLNLIMHKLFAEHVDTQWYEISAERAYKWCEEISRVRKTQAANRAVMNFDPDRHND